MSVEQIIKATHEKYPNVPLLPADDCSKMMESDILQFYLIADLMKSTKYLPFQEQYFATGV